MALRERLAQIRGLYGPILAEAAAQYGHRPEVLAGIMMRETEGGFSRYLDKPGPGGRGDMGHGHGLMQIDDRSFPEFCRSDAWKDPTVNIHFGAHVLARKRDWLRKKAIPQKLLIEADLERASIASYNCGQGNVLRALREHEDVDTYTAGRNYSRKVLEFAGIYSRLGETEERA